MLSARKKYNPFGLLLQESEDIMRDQWLAELSTKKRRPWLAKTKGADWRKETARALKEFWRIKTYVKTITS